MARERVSSRRRLPERAQVAALGWPSLSDYPELRTARAINNKLHDTIELQT